MMGEKKSVPRLLMESALVLAAPLTVRRRRPTLRLKALIVKPDRIGDLALTAPLIQALATRFGAGRIGLVVSEVNSGLARAIFPGVHLFEAPLYARTARFGAWRATLRALAHVEAEDAFLFRHFWRPPHVKALWRFLRAQRKHWVIAAEGRLAPESGDRVLLPGKSLELRGAAPAGVALDAHLSNLLLAQAYGALVTPLPVSAPTFSEPPPAELGSRVLMFPFASDPLRDLTAAQVIAICAHLATTHRLAVLLAATADRTDDLQRLREQFIQRHPASAAFTPKTWTPPNFAAFHQAILAARFIVSTDSGPAHLAIIHDRPLVALLGGGQFGVFAPWTLSERQTWIHHPLPCYGCDWHCRFERAHCVTDIPPPAVCAAIDLALSPRNDPGTPAVPAGVSP
jgi:ADP-heptose:LPS heptosyltransferase